MNAKNAKKLSELVASENFLFVPLGGGRETGRNCYFLRFAGKNFLLDCGVQIGKSVTLPLLKALEGVKLDAVFVTHAHSCSVGALPELFKQVQPCQVYMTGETFEVAKLVLRELAIKIGDEGYEYSQDQVEAVINNVLPVAYNVQIPFGEVAVTFLASGHFPGGAMLLITGADKAFLYIGHFSLRDTYLIEGQQVEKIREGLGRNKVDLMVANIGGNEKNQMEKFLGKVRKVTSKGTLLVSVEPYLLAEPLVALLTAQTENRISPGVTTYVIGDELQAWLKVIKPFVRTRARNLFSEIKCKKFDDISDFRDLDGAVVFVPKFDVRNQFVANLALRYADDLDSAIVTFVSDEEVQSNKKALDVMLSWPNAKGHTRTDLSHWAKTTLHLTPFCLIVLPHLKQT